MVAAFDANTEVDNKINAGKNQSAELQPRGSLICSIARAGQEEVAGRGTHVFALQVAMVYRDAFFIVLKNILARNLLHSMPPLVGKPVPRIAAVCTSLG